MSDRNPQINKPLIAAGIAGLCILTALITAFFITLFLRMGKDEDTESKKEKKTTSSVSESEESESEKAEPGEQMSAETDAGGQAYQMLMSLDDLSDDEVEDIYREILDAYKEAWRDDFDNYDDVNINPNMTKSELGIPKNLSYAFIDFADDGFPELVVANVDKNGYKVLDLVGIEVDLQSPDQTKTAKRIFDQFPSKSFNLRLIRYLVEKGEEDESDDSDSESDEETDSKKDDKDKDDKDKDKDGKKKDDKDKDDKKDSKDDEEEEEWMNLLYTADWDPDSDVRMMDLDILNPRMVTTTSFMEIRRRPDLKDGEDDAFTVREGDEEAESVSEEKYTAVTYGIMENSKDYEVDWNPISDWKG